MCSNRPPFYQMGTDHSQWKCVAYFLSPELQKESFGGSYSWGKRAGAIRALRTLRGLNGSDQPHLGPPQPKCCGSAQPWALSPGLPVLLGLCCRSAGLQLICAPACPGHGLLIQTPATQLISWPDLGSTFLPCTMGWTLSCQRCCPCPLGSNWPACSTVGTLKWFLLLAWTTATYAA